jgi:predicted amino acid-binding ACT domain protein
MDHCYVLSILIADRVGILSAITSGVTDLGANIHDRS